MTTTKWTQYFRFRYSKARTAEALHEIEEPIGSYGPVPFYRECAHGGHILLDEFRHPTTKNNLNEPAVAGAKVESAVDIQSVIIT